MRSLSRLVGIPTHRNEFHDGNASDTHDGIRTIKINFDEQ
jgi:hypothetical protein